MTYFLSNSSVTVIDWPDANEQVEIERHFRQNGFPGVIGAIDGSHVKIDKPEDDPDSYINRKQFYSIHLQVVCDHKRKIRDVFIGFPGSVHDSRVFRASPLSDSLDEKCGENYILGDSGYPCLPHLLTPYRDMGNLGRIKTNFNVKLSHNRYVIEHCFGILKQKFRQLYHLKLRKIRDCVHFIRTCCVLHNLALEGEMPENFGENPEEVVNPRPIIIEDEGNNHDGFIIRNKIANMLE